MSATLSNHPTQSSKTHLEGGSWSRFQQMFHLICTLKFHYRIYEACPENRDTNVLNIYNIFNVPKGHCELIACT